MGMEDRDWWRNAQKERDMKRISERFKAANNWTPSQTAKSLEARAIWKVVFVVTVFGMLYIAMSF